MSDSDDVPMSLRRPNDAGAESATASLAPVFASSVPPASVDATLPARLRAVVQCAHPEECVSRCTVLEADDRRLPIQWCGACGAIAVAQGDAMSWTRPGMAELVLGDAIARLAIDLAQLQEAIGEVARSTRLFVVDTAERARALEDTVTALERTAGAVLAAIHP